MFILEELSLFTHIGFYNKYSVQSDFIINQHSIESREVFEEIIFKLAEIGIIKITGDFIILEVFVEELAFKRLEKLADDNLDEFFNFITKNGLANQFSKRLIELNKLKGTYQLIDVLSKESGLLTKYNFINSDQGARIIMSLAELKPEKILKSVENLLNNKSVEELRQLKKGRRYLVWALERLAFRKISFHGAAKLLYKLSIAENETISNNATGQFIHLFQALVSGTEASLDQRIVLLKEIISEEKEEFNVVNKALEHALLVHGFMRSGGADEQACEKLKDYQPKDYAEILEYWQSIINLLLDLGSYGILVGQLNLQIYYGNGRAILDALETLLEEKETIDKELRQQFENILNDSRELPKEISQKIQAILQRYTKDTIHDKLEFLVALAPYSTYESGDGIRINRSEEKVNKLVKDLTTIGNEFWFDDIDILLSGEQRLTFYFGKILASFWQNHDDLIEIILKKLSNISFENQNISFLAGYLSGHSNQDFIRKVVDLILADDKIAYHSLHITRLLDIQLKDLIKLKTLINNTPKFIVDFQYFSIKDLSEYISFFKLCTFYKSNCAKICKHT